MSVSVMRQATQPADCYRECHTGCRVDPLCRMDRQGGGSGHTSWMVQHWGPSANCRPSLAGRAFCIYLPPLADAHNRGRQVALWCYRSRLVCQPWRRAQQQICTAAAGQQQVSEQEARTTAGAAIDGVSCSRSRAVDSQTTTAFSPKSHTNTKRCAGSRMIWCGCGASCLACLPSPADPW